MTLSKVRIDLGGGIVHEGTRTQNTGCNNNTLGANCTVVCGTTIGRHAFVGAGAVVSRDVPDYALVVGVPARQIGWMSRHGEPLALPLKGDGSATCPATGERYLLRQGVCALASEAAA